MPKKKSKKKKSGIVRKCFKSRGKMVCRNVRILASGKWRFVKGKSKKK